ncbi:anaphase-promoting complex subunit 3 [Cryptococcus gattii E566]|uniref:Ubiquitin-protein ligase, putative n=2 Tax=Cryptococcus gattii TaxID=37769 RepID=E6R0J4_CRYGW|nr:Ubiquitin-protein ligase, putative [Cryptococcus gattii WM276]ADV20325.1 Ubiquitin-protein ligase, putative [Cryptococcus gattii WM276]KIR77138.1 anaphase-promoting complex subunit 3 [Cryptococcus gattii EJB2]KIY36170.1 anaphase-promoting complex subunit 3 [Cryptococcus gattii E566]KJE06181.1 anaphase-promoting complex subunit 3 [Cryptococcus gattii NT-10]
MNTHVAARLQQLASSYPPHTALFYARIWHTLAPATDNNHDSLHALALAFLQAAEPYSAIHLVRDHTGLDNLDLDLEIRFERTDKVCGGCAMIVARCYLTLPTPSSNPATAYLLLANLSHKGKSPETAIENYRKALDEDPWMWEAFTSLCDVGTLDFTVVSLFQPTQHASRSSRPPLSPNVHRQKSPIEPAPGVLRLHQAQAGVGNSGGLFTPDVEGMGGKTGLGMMGNTSSWDSSSIMGDATFALPEQQTKRPFPSFMSTATSFLPSSLRGGTSTPAGSDSPPKLPTMKRPRGKDPVKRPGPVETPQSQMSSGLPLARELRPNGAKYEDSDAPRRSSRLKTTTSKSSSKNPRDPRVTRSRSVTSSNSNNEAPSPPSLTSQDAILQKEADEYLKDIVKKCARVYKSLSQYQCQQAIKEVDVLPGELKTSPWAMEILGRAFYEIANYAMARRAFTFLQQQEPYRIQSMEQFSTLLWHLTDLPALSYLSQSLISISRTSPQAWIAVGNCFSLQKDHDEAMRCFRRATQLDEGCAYAWTLCGYEAVEMEEYERAMAFYRTAIRTDARHYNAWYGMGLVYLKTDRPRYAEHHFRRAVEINPTNPVLLCCVGMALEKSDDVVQALHFYERASKYAPTSAMVQFKRIRALVALQRYDEAISALEPLTHSAPDEANVFFLLGKCLFKKERRQEATVAFTNARELEPKLESAINAVLVANGEEGEESE